MVFIYVSVHTELACVLLIIHFESLQYYPKSKLKSMNSVKVHDDE